MALWTGRDGSDLIGQKSLQANRCWPGAVQHEFDDDWSDRAATSRPIRAQRALVLDDLHRAIDLRRLPVVALRPDPSDADLGPDLYLQRDRAALRRHLRSLFSAHAGDCA